MLRGELVPDAGSFRINGRLACLDQGLSLIVRDLSPLANLLAVAPTLSESDARTRLAGIALRGDRALMPCHGLSGGERLKLGLLMVLAQLPDLLLLDEPDNHLDHPSRQLLIQVLADYPAAVSAIALDSGISFNIISLTSYFSLKNYYIGAYQIISNSYNF